MQVDAVAGLRRRGILMPGYGVLDHVLEGNRRLAPPTTCRAPAALIERGGVHRRESLKSLVACGCERRGHVPILSIRRECGVLEYGVSPHVADELSTIAGQSGFAPAHQEFEVRGPYPRLGSDEAPA